MKFEELPKLNLYDRIELVFSPLFASDKFHHNFSKKLVYYVNKEKCSESSRDYIAICDRLGSSCGVIISHSPIRQYTLSNIEKIICLKEK